MAGPFPPIPAVGHVTLMRAADPTAAGVFVEGPDDVEMWTRWLRQKPLERGGAGGVREAIQEIRAAGLAGCLGIVDADLDRLTRSLAVDADILVSEAHDHECDLARSGALDMLLDSLPGAKDEILRLASPASFREAIRTRAVPFGRLRWLFHARRTAFPSSLTPNSDIGFDRATWTVKHEELFDRAAKELAVGRGVLDAELSGLRVAADDEWQVCNGHDVVALIRLAFAMVPAAKERCFSEKSVAWALRSGLDSSHLPSFPLWRSLLAWETANAPFVAQRSP